MGDDESDGCLVLLVDSKSASAASSPADNCHGALPHHIYHRLRNLGDVPFFGGILSWRPASHPFLLYLLWTLKKLPAAFTINHGKHYKINDYDHDVYTLL